MINKIRGRTPPSKIALNPKTLIKLTGSILTRIDGDSRGGAALSMKFTTGCPIKFMGTGELIDDLEIFYPERIKLVEETKREKKKN